MSAAIERFAYCREDGGEMGEYLWMNAATEAEAMSQAEEYSRLCFDDWTETPPTMLLYRMTFIAAGVPKITPGAPLDDVPGDKEPDEFDSLVWEGRVQ